LTIRLRSLVKKYLPPELIKSCGRMQRVFSASRRHAYRERSARQAVWATVRQLTGNTVVGGPFEGLSYIPSTHWGNVAALLLGTYEQEIAPIVTSWLQDGLDTFIDVGCAEGYYAVGIASRLPAASVIAFDSSEQSQAECREMSRLNGVAARVDVRGCCDHSTLNELVELPGRTVLFVDCEGCELDLLRPDRVPGLMRVEMLIELHEFCRAGLTETILNRFRDTHVTVLITAGTHTVVPAVINHLSEDFVQRALDELRPTVPHRMQWAHLVPEQ